MAEMAQPGYSVQHPREHRERLDHDNAKQVPTVSDACAKPGLEDVATATVAPSPKIRRYPRTPVDEAFEREFEQKHQEWLKGDEKRRLAEEEARQAGVRAVQRLLEELSDNPFELIPRASELSAETLAEHLTTEDVAQTLRALHKESARNLERLKFHVRLSLPEQGSEFQATPKANSASLVGGDAEPEAEAIPGDTPCVRPPWSGDLTVADVEEDNEFVAEAKAPSWALPQSRPVSTPDVHREGLEASWASKPSQIENGKTQSLSEELESEARASGPSKILAEGASHQGTEHVEMKAYQVGSDTLTGKKRCMEDWMNQDSSLVVPLGPNKLLVGVFDGHGEQGQQVSASVGKLFAHFAEDLEKLTEAAPMEQVLPRQFANLFSLAQDGLRRGGLAEWSGTTATLAMIDTEAGCVVCAYVGDSRMIIAHNQRVLFATNDHDVDDEAERRVTAAGGEVRRMWVSGIDARRVFLRGSDIPGLSMSRALGDLQASAVGVLNEPSIHTCVQIPGGSAVILASDGLWEKVTTQEVAAITSAALKLKSDDQGATVAAKALVSEARSRWIQEGGDVDDITAVVVHLGEEQHMDFSVG